MSNCLQASDKDRGLWEDLRRLPENKHKCKVVHKRNNIQNSCEEVQLHALTVAEVARVDAALQRFRLGELGEHLGQRAAQLTRGSTGLLHSVVSLRKLQRQIPEGLHRV